MTGHKSWLTLSDKMNDEQRRRSDEMRVEMQAEMVLSELRKHTGMTQKELASKLGLAQPTLSLQEHQDDMEISTLSRLVEAMGGQLELVVHMPKGDVRLTQFSNTLGSQPEATR